MKEKIAYIVTSIVFMISGIMGVVVGLNSDKIIPKCVEHQERPIIKTECKRILFHYECKEYQDIEKYCVKYNKR